MTIEEISDYGDLESLKGEWDFLIRESGADCFHLTHEWTSAWWKNLGTGNKLFILLAREGGKTLGIAPLMISRGRLSGIPVRKIEFIGAGWGYGGFILGDKKELCIRLMMDYLVDKSKIWDVAALCRVPADPEETAIIESSIKESGLLSLTEKEHIPCIALIGTWQDYLSERSYSFRRNFKNRERRIKKIGPVFFDRHNNGKCVPDLGKLMDTVFDISSRSWKWKEGTAIASSEEVRNFYLTLAQVLHERGWLELSILKVNGKPVSYMLGALYKRKYIDIDIAFDEAYSSSAPGNLHRIYLLKNLFEEDDADIFDFGAAFEYKKEYTSSEKEFKSILLFKKSIYSLVQYAIRSRIFPLVRKKRDRRS